MSGEMPESATELLGAYVECAMILRWIVEHDGECPADHPKMLAWARDALARTEERPPQKSPAGPRGDD